MLPRHLRAVVRILSLPRLIALLLVLGFAARAVRYFLAFPLWGDEAFVAVNFLQRGFREMIEPLLYGQIAPLGYMWATLATVKVLGLSEYAIRLVPFLAGLVGLLLFWRFVASQFSRRTTVLAIGFLAAAYYPIRHTNEVKPYSTDLLVSLGLFMLAWAVCSKPRSPLRWLVLIVYTGLAVWCSYPVIFVAAGTGLLLTWRMIRFRTPLTILGWAMYGLVLCGSFTGMYRIYAKPHAEAAADVAEINMWKKTYPPVSEPWMLPFWFIEAHTGNMLAYPAGAKNGGSSATFLLVLAGCITLWKSGRRDLLLLLLSPLAFNMIAAALHKYPYGGTVRVMLYMAPSFCLLAGLGLTVCLRQLGTMLIYKVPFAYNRLAVPAVAIAFAAVAATTMTLDLTSPFKKDANYAARQTVTWLAGQVTPADQTVVFNALTSTVPYAPYIAPWRGDGAQFIFYMTRDIRSKLLWAPPADQVKPLPGGRTWFVVYAGEEFRVKHDEYRSLDPDYGSAHPQFDPMLAAYRQILNQNLGPAEEHRFPLQEKRGIKGYQQIDIYAFGNGR